MTRIEFGKYCKLKEMCNLLIDGWWVYIDYIMVNLPNLHTCSRAKLCHNCYLRQDYNGNQTFSPLLVESFVSFLYTCHQPRLSWSRGCLWYSSSTEFQLWWAVMIYHCAVYPATYVSHNIHQLFDVLIRNKMTQLFRPNSWRNHICSMKANLDLCNK